MSSLTTFDADHQSRISLRTGTQIQGLSVSEKRAKLAREARLQYAAEVRQLKEWNRAGRAMDPKYFPMMCPKGTWSSWEPKPPAKQGGRLRRGKEWVGGEKLVAPKRRIDSRIPELRKQYEVRQRVEVSRKAHWLPPAAVGTTGPERKLDIKDGVDRTKTDYIEGKMKLPKNDLTNEQNRSIACSHSRRRWGKYRNART